MIPKPDGIESVTTTPVAVDGPRLVTVQVKVTLLSTKVEEGDATCEIPRSAAGLMRVVVCTELLAGRQSEPAELVTDAMFVSVPAASGWNVSVTVAVALPPIAPRLHVTIPLARAGVLPCVVVPVTNEAPAGTGSDTTTLLAVDGPKFVTVNVYVKLTPA